MQSEKVSSDSSYPRDPRSIPPRRISHYKISGQHSRESDTGRSKRKDADDDESDVEQYNFEKLKNFQIPRKKGKGEKELLNEIPLSAREYTHKIYQTFRSSFFDPQSSKRIFVTQAEVVHNEKLEKEYLAKKKDMKDEGRSEKDLSDSFGYLHFFKRSEVEKVCKDGLSVGHCNLTSLGKPDMGVYICRNADIVRFSKWEDNLSGYIVMFKIMKGKAKLVTECRATTTDQEPTPLYDCHFTKLPIDIAQSIHGRAYQAMQYYFYEYGDIDIVQRPRQVLPYAVLKYTYKDPGNSSSAASRTNRRESSQDEVSCDSSSGVTSPALLSTSDSGFCHWRGMLLVKNGTFCPVEMRSHLDTVFNVANVDRNINIKTCLPLEKLKRQLPPTLMSRSAKKYNVIYRGRHYNTFTLHPTEEGSGLGKFRQLISHLVQRSASAFIPLRNNSSLHLLPISGLTEEMGLRSAAPELVATSESTKQSQRAWKNFLHVIIITPKALSSKINDQRVYNVINTRKRKDTSSTAPMSTVRDALEQKLRQMNIDPSLALSSMDPEQQQKIFDRVKDKKKLQTSEKMLHNHYKEVDMSSSIKSGWKKKLHEKWSNSPRLQQEMYSGKKKLKIIPSPGGTMRRTYSRSSTETSADISFDDNTEATFSDDEDASSRLPPTSYKMSKRVRLDEGSRDIGGTSVMHRADPRTDPANKSKAPAHLPSTVKPKPNAPGTPSLILRPSFKPLEELIFSENLEELMKHPEFSFTEKHCSTHKVSGFLAPFNSDGPYVPWEEKQPHISVTFSQKVPYVHHNTDCPYAFEKDPLILSMLHAVHGDYNVADDNPEDYEKVNWVRRILHNREPSGDVDALDTNSNKQPPGMERKIVEHLDDKTSPKPTETSPHMSSTDSGFVSSSAAGTPGDISIPDSPSLKDIAAIIASALTQSKASTEEPTQKAPDLPTATPTESNPDMDLAAKALLEALVQPKSSRNEGEGGVDSLTDDLEGVDMEIGSTPDHSPVRDSSRLKEPGPSLTTSQKDIMKSPLPAAAKNAQGSQPSGKDPLHHPHPHPLSQPQKIKIPREEATLKALRKLIPGLTKDELQQVLARVAPLVKKMVAKMERHTRITSRGTIIKAMTDTRLLNKGMEKPHQQGSTGIDRGKMTITLTHGKKTQDIAKDGEKETGKKIINIPALDLGKGKATEKQPLKETLVTKPTETLKLIGDMSIGGRPRFVLPGGSGDLHYSAIGPVMTTPSITRMRHPTLQGGAPSLVKPRTTTVTKPPTTIETVITRKSHPKDVSSLKTPMTSMCTITTQQTDQGNRPSGPVPGKLSLPSQGPVPYCPIPPGQGHGYFAVQPSGCEPQDPGQGLTRAGGSSLGSMSSYPPRSISEQNTELLNTILNLFNAPKQDPRLAQNQSRKLQTSTVYASTTPTVSKLSQDSNMSSQISSILQQLTTSPGALTSTTASSSTASSRLSPSDIQRIRKKKQKMNIHRELCRREAMQMRQELNKIIKHKRKRSKRTKGHSLSRQKAAGSPESTNSSNSGDTSRQQKDTSERVKPQFSLSQSASSKVLEDVAFALTGQKAESSVHSLTTAGPAVIVSAPYCLGQPVFTRPKVTATEVTAMSSSLCYAGTFHDSENTTAIPADATRVISEIDTALSQLKRGLQAKVDNDELKESMGNLLRLVLKLDSGNSSAASAEELPISAPSDVAISSSEPVEQQNFSKDGDLRQTLNAARGMLFASANVPSQVSAATTSSSYPAVSSTVAHVISHQTSLFGASLETVPEEKLLGTEPMSVFEDVSDRILSPAVAREKDEALKEYEVEAAKQTETERQKTTPDQPPISQSTSVDELLANLKPYIEGINKAKELPSPVPPVPSSPEKRDATATEVPSRSSSVANSPSHVISSCEAKPTVSTCEPEVAKPHASPEIKDLKADTTSSHLRDPVHDETSSQVKISRPVSTPAVVVPDTELSSSGMKVNDEESAASQSQKEKELLDSENQGMPQEKQSTSPMHDPPTARVEPLSHTNVDANSPMNFTSQPATENVIVRPQPTHLQGPSLQISDTGVMRSIANLPPTVLHASCFYSIPQADHDSPLQHAVTLSPVKEPDRGSTPTMDERYPDPVPPHKRRRLQAQSRVLKNSFIVFNPDNSLDCEEISSYLESVNGVRFNVSKMVEDLASRVKKRKESNDYQITQTLEEEYQKLLPPGTIWVVFRTVDLKRLHFMPHLSLLKAAGSHVHFVSANSITDIKARQYKNILNGDGGILIPLCPKTLLNDPIRFRHLMLWLIGQDVDGGKNRNKWRIALHQHVLNSLQDAEHIGYSESRQNATQVLEWLCEISKNKARLAIELVEHHCDKIPPAGGKGRGPWNWYDSASDDELIKTALPCLMKLQKEKVRQLRHLVVLIDGDPGSDCWKPVWHSGCCVSTLENFVDMICPKPAGFLNKQSTSCVLPLYSPALSLL